MPRHLRERKWRSLTKMYTPANPAPTITASNVSVGYTPLGESALSALFALAVNSPRSRSMPGILAVLVISIASRETTAFSLTK